MGWREFLRGFTTACRRDKLDLIALNRGRRIEPC